MEEIKKLLEVYSRNVSALANAPIALNNVALLKGNSTQLQGVSTIQLNKCGVYEISVSAVATAETAGQISIQLEKDGVLQPQAYSAVTAADTTSVHPLGFTTLVQVTHNNNTNCVCATPTNIDIINTGEAATFNSIKVTVIRI